MSARQIWMGVFIGVIMAVIFLWRGFMARWRAVRNKIRLVCTCGHVPDPPTDAADRVMRIVARCLVWIQVGRVQVSGIENLACSSPKLIAPTHGHYIDPFVMALLLPERARCMAARGLLEFGGGLGALMFSQWGVFCTDLRTGKGARALVAGVRILVSGQTLVMFPEGWAHLDGAVGPFRRGAVSIARMTAARVGRPVSIVPVHLRYGAYPGAWIKKFPPAFQCLIVLLGFIFFRRGVHVIVGEPLLSSQLPEHPTSATEELRCAILALNPCPAVRTCPS